MTRIAVSSSNLKSVGFEDGTLEIEFHDGRIYQYYDVGDDTYTGLMNARSKGQYHAQYIQDRYPYRRIQ